MKSKQKLTLILSGLLVLMLTAQQSHAGLKSKSGKNCRGTEVQSGNFPLNQHGSPDDIQGDYPETRMGGPDDVSDEYSQDGDGGLAPYYCDDGGDSNASQGWNGL